MGSDVPMILPKGIVVNTEDVYNEIASHKLVPFDRVWQVWRVYTTTNRKLEDPTARRLENFWWHVMGSNRRLLSGETLATLYEDISLGPTFVPLRGPPNRWEGDDLPPTVQQALAILENEKARAQPQSETALNNKGSPSGLKGLSASAAKPPPRHPILKKPRGPSASGPRPTARFVSPHASGDEDDEDSNSFSSGSTVTPALEMKLPNPSPPKKKTSTKKFVASTAGGKRRPALPRKTSSQSSGISDHGVREAPSPANSRSPDTLLEPTPPIPESETTDNTADQNASLKLSAKAAGKRPMVPRMPVVEKSGAPPQEVPEIASTKSPNSNAQAFPKITSSPLATSNSSQGENLSRPRSSINLSGARSGNIKPGTSTSPSDNGSTGSTTFTSVPISQSRSHSDYVRTKENSTGQRTGSGLFTGATSSTTNVAAQGVIIDQSGSFGAGSTTGFFDRDDVGPRSGSFSSSLLEPRLVPTPPSTSASVPLGRTRSQLTLLLEREKEARAGSKHRSKS